MIRKHVKFYLTEKSIFQLKRVLHFFSFCVIRHHHHIIVFFFISTFFSTFIDFIKSVLSFSLSLILSRTQLFFFSSDIEFFSQSKTNGHLIISYSLCFIILYPYSICISLQNPCI